MASVLLQSHNYGDVDDRGDAGYHRKESHERLKDDAVTAIGAEEVYRRFAHMILYAMLCNDMQRYDIKFCDRIRSTRVGYVHGKRKFD